jgi:hypothetical protein
MMTAKDLLIQSSSSAQTSATMKTMVLVGDVLRPSHQHLSQMMKAAMATKTTEVFTKLSNVRGLQLSRFLPVHGVWVRQGIGCAKIATVMRQFIFE